MSAFRVACCLVALAACVGAQLQLTDPSIRTVNGSIHISAPQVMLVNGGQTLDVWAAFSDTMHTIAQLQNQISAVNSTSQQALSDLRATVQQQAGVITQQTNEINLLKAQLASVNNTLNAAQQQTSSQLTAVSNQLGGSVSSLQQQLNANITALTGQLSATNGSAAAAQQQLSGQLASLASQLLTTNSTANAARDQLATLASTTAASISALSANASQFLTTAAAATAYFPLAAGSTLSGQLSALGSTAAQLNATVNTQGTQIAALTVNATQFLTLSSANATFLSRANAVAQFQQLSGPIRFPDGTTQSTAAVTLLPPNLISNSYMNLVDGNGQPTGWSTFVYTTGGPAATITIQAVSPYTYCFEGPYTPTAPAGSAATCNQATAASPFWFGVYNTGPRVSRGGLGPTGWGSLPGNILRVVGTRQDQSHPTVLMPRQFRAVSDRLLLRGWIKIITGSGVRFGTDYGYDLTFTKSQTDAAPDGWLFINQEIGPLSSIANFNYVHAHVWTGFGTGPNGVGNFEFYIALPYIGMLGGLARTWVPSVMDVIRDSQSGASPFAG